MHDGKILIVSHYYGENIVGAQRVRHLVSLLEGKGLEVSRVDNRQGDGKGAFDRRVFFRIWNFRGDIVLVSCGPFYYLVAATLAAAARGKKLVVDFRDPLSFNTPLPGKGISVRNIAWSARRFWAKARERFTYRCSSNFIVCTSGMFELYARLFKDTGKLRLIPNGFDFQPMEASLRAGNRPDEERFICIGKFLEYSETKAREIFAKLGERKRSLGKSIRVVFYNDEETRLREFLAGATLPEGIAIEYRGRVPYEEAIREAKTCDCGLVIIRNERFDVGTKIYDFIGLGLPVLDVFDHRASFYKAFHAFCLDPGAPMFRYQPDMRYYRSSGWMANLDVFGLQPVDQWSPSAMCVEPGEVL